MLTSYDLVEMLRNHYKTGTGPATVYRVAKQLGYGNGRVLNWHHCRNTPSQTETVKLATILDLDPGYVLACMECQRQSEPEIAEAWEAVAKRSA